MPKKVHILLSAYNGEQFIREQLDSLLAQTYPHIEIHVRDDGSSDHTCSILREYEIYPQVHVYEGENIGFRRSFAWLLEHCREADYFAFCDQDDIWMPQKIEEAVRALRKYEDVPALYIGDFYWADAQCRPLHANGAWSKPHTLTKYITTGDMNTFGFTEVFNRKAAEGIYGRWCTEICVHDQVIYLYCLCSGKTIWGREPLAYYRRYGGNASTQEKQGGSRLTHLVWQVRTFLLEDGHDRIYGRFEEFYRAYKADLSPKDAATFRLYTGRGHRLQKAFYRGRYRDKWTDELAIRVMFLLGKV